MNPFAEMDREQLLHALEIFAKNWLAHDGCWFLAAEESHGLETAIRLINWGWIAHLAPPRDDAVHAAFGAAVALQADSGLLLISTIS